jgi:hypothetical protein
MDHRSLAKAFREHDADVAGATPAGVGFDLASAPDRTIRHFARKAAGGLADPYFRALIRELFEERERIIDSLGSLVRRCAPTCVPDVTLTGLYWQVDCIIASYRSRLGEK